MLYEDKQVILRCVRGKWERVNKELNGFLVKVEEKERESGIKKMRGEKRKKKKNGKSFLEK